MSPQGLPTALYVEAHLRRLTQEGVHHYVVRKGAYAAGIVLLKINTITDGCLLLQQQRDIYGMLGWMAQFGGRRVDEVEADQFIGRAIDRDPDLWVVEVEDKEGKNPFEGRIF